MQHQLCLHRNSEWRGEIDQAKGKACLFLFPPTSFIAARSAFRGGDCCQFSRGIGIPSRAAFVLAAAVPAAYKTHALF
jgi:hypothetical protein